MYAPMSKSRLLLLRHSAQVRRLVRDTRAAVAVEMAFILPIFAAIVFLTWDAGTVYTQYNRSTSNLYSIGDLITTRTEDITCDQLDAMSELVYQSYAHGNWARRQRDDDADFTDEGAPDFRFVTRMIRVELQPTGDLKGVVEWEYRRQQGNVETAGELVDVPSEMEVDGMRYLDLTGNIRVAPALNYMGVFDYQPDSGETYLEVEIDSFFPIRFVPNVALIEKPSDRYDEKCNISTT